MKKGIILGLTLLVSNLMFALNLENGFIVDSRGNKVESKEYKRIVLLDPAAVEAFYILEGEDNIVAIADTARNPIWPVEKTSKLAKAGNLMKPSLEQVLMYKPDLVIVNVMAEAFGDSLKGQNIKYLLSEANSFDEILGNLAVYGVISGKEEKSKELIDVYNGKLNSIKEKIVANPLNIKGGFLFATSPMMVFTRSSLPGEIFSILGIENIADGLAGGRPIVSPEYLLAQNPDILVGSMAISNKDDILNSNPVVKQTKAGKNGNIMIMDSDRILRGTPRVIDALDDLHKELENAK